MFVEGVGVDVKYDVFGGCLNWCVVWGKNVDVFVFVFFVVSVFLGVGERLFW